MLYFHARIMRFSEGVFYADNRLQINFNLGGISQKDLAIVFSFIEAKTFTNIPNTRVKT
jgi:hypothetical protein